MKVKIMPNYFLVKIDKELQRRRKELIPGSQVLYQPPSSTFNSANMEHGLIEQIGDNIKNIYGFDSCRIGHILIFHWSVEDEKSKNNHFLFEDDKYNYYWVDEPVVRGYFDGKNITPHPNYIFLKNVPAFKTAGEYDEALGLYVKKDGALITFSEWKDSASETVQKSEHLKQEIISLSRTTQTSDVRIAMEEKEKERKILNRVQKKKRYLPYRVAYKNKMADRDFGVEIKEDDLLYCLSSACGYLSNFQNKEYRYIICPTEYIAFLDRRNMN